MSETAFARKIIQKMKTAIGTDGKSYSGVTASAAMIAVAQGVTEYLIENTTVDVAYNGIIPGIPPTPDPCVSDTFKIVGVCEPPTQSNSFDDWFMQLQNNIIAGFMLAPFGNVGVVFAQKPFLYPVVNITQLDLKSAHRIDDEAPQQKIWEIICGGIISWINGAAINTTPNVATRPLVGSSGMGNIVRITLM